MNEKKAPAIRFQKFTDFWGHHNFGTISYRESTKQLSSEEYPCLEYDDVISETGQLNKDIHAKKVQKTGIIFDNNKVLYGKLRPYLHNWIAPEFIGVATGDWWVLNPCGNNKDFLYALIQTKQFDTIANQSTGSKMPRADWKLVSSAEFYVPPIEEQRKIGECFHIIDNLISLHQRKLTKLKLLKKSMLSKMFPKDGAHVPEIRFQGFHDDWKQKKFGNENFLITGYPFESEKYVNEGITLIRGMNVKRGFLDLSDGICMKWSSSKGFENYLLKNDDILIQMDGALIGKSYAKITKNQLPALLVQRVTRARVKKYIADADFMYQTIQKDFLPYIKLNKTETAVPHLSLNDIRNFTIMVPSFNEQQKIGAYFNSLDKLINLHQRKLSKLQQIKQAMLSKLFV